MDIKEALIVFGKIKVLHVDDDELQLGMLKIKLEEINDEIIVDSEINGLKALEKIKTNEYDCIILDYLMPIYDGIEIANRIRSFSKVPIILYTVQGSEELAERSFSVVVNDYIRKELNVSNYSVLENKILSVVNKHRIQKISEKILNNVNDSIVIIDKDFNICYHNDKFINYTEKTSLIRTPILNIIEKSYKELFNDFLINKEETMIKVILERSKNINHYVDIHKSIISNNYDYLILNITEVITHDLKIEKARSSDDRFSVISKMSPDGIIMLSLYGYITYVNPAFLSLTGFSEEEFVGKHIINVPTLKGRDMKPYLRTLKDFFSRKFDFSTLEFPYTRKDGTSGIGDAYCSTVKVNGKMELITIIKDITDKRKKEEEYLNIFKTSPEGIIHLNMDGEIKDINNAGLKLLNIDSSEYIGRSIFSVESELSEDDINFINIYNKIISNKKVDPFQIQFNIGDNIQWIEIYVSLIKAYEENLGIQILLRDITQQKESENENKSHMDKLEEMVEERTNQIMDNEKMVTLAKVSSMLAHDLKGPLQIINNSLHLIKYKPDDREQYLEYIQNAVKQANELIEEMRIKGKETPLKLENVNLENIIDEASIQVKVSETIKFETTIKTDKKIRLDKTKFIRVFNNLFKNAIEAMPNGGKITIIVEEKQSNISIEVIDTGLGIPQEKINTIFRPFQSTKAKGMGLGLTFCKNTVEAHGGNISVKSEQRKGTTFTIVIPTNRDYDTDNYVENSIKIKDTLN